MDRVTKYYGSLVQETDLLQSQQDGMVGLGWALQATLGTATAVDGFTCTPTSPASLNVLLTPGAVYQQEDVEATTWSSLPANTTSQIVKQGLMQIADEIGITPPSTSGYSQNFLIEVQYADLDTNPVLLPYYDAADPSVPYSGPANSGTSQNTARLGIAAVQVKAGTAATTGTQATPSADAGWTGLFVVIVAQGATTITSGNITQLSTAPFIPVKLPAVPAAIQNGSWVSADDTGSANTYVITPQPAISAYAKYQAFRVKIANTNTGASTLKVNGLGAKAVIGAGGAALNGNELVAGRIVSFVYDGTSFQMAPASLGRLINIQVLTAASGTYTPTPGTQSIIVDAVADGGASGSVASNGAANNSTAGGGQAGARVRAWFTSGFASGVSYTIGQGGAPAAAGDNPGGAGSGLTFGALISCPGGAGGRGGASIDINTANAIGAPGGNSSDAPTVTGAALVLMASPGVPGGIGMAFSGALIIGGLGGAWPDLGVTPAPASVSSDTVVNAGVAASQPGAGASAPSSNTDAASAAGKAGFRGQITVCEYS